MLIGTHSRVIEGKLIELLYKNGRYLNREKPSSCMGMSQLPWGYDRGRWLPMWRE
jgi:hypothetical protein